MRFMRFLSALAGSALLAGEVARRGDSVLAQPKAWDDLAAGAVLLLLALLGPRAAPAFQAAGWGLFTGVMLASFGINVDAMLAGEPKPRAGFYAGVLAALATIGAGAPTTGPRRR